MKNLSSKIKVSIVIKALNEEKKIAKTIQSCLDAVRGLDAEIILADSCSTDKTIEIAKEFPIKIVQLKNPKEKCCGIGPQLGYQHSVGDYVLVIDGDMVLERDWFHKAIALLDADPLLGGVGGVVDDVNLDNIEFQARKQRQPKDMEPGYVDRLNMGGLYRRAAIEKIDYLTHRGLHACEEFELGLRITSAGWKLFRLNDISIHHYGHTIPILQLVRKRWRSKYINGLGELLKASWGNRWFASVFLASLLYLTVIGWLLLCLALLGFSIYGAVELYLPLLIFIMPYLVMIVKKRSLLMGCYSVFSWMIDAAGLLRGVVSSLPDPRREIDSRVIKS